MNWVLEHLQLIIVVSGAIAYWLNQRRKAQEEEADAQAPQERRGEISSTAEAAEQAERTRRIQEEIRRKILERAGGRPAPQSAPPPLPPQQEEEPRVLEPVAPVYRAPEPRIMEPDRRAEEEAALLERQQQLAARLRELEEKRREHVGRAAAFAEKTAATLETHSAREGSLLADLRSPRAARRAIVLREVLGTPLGLR